MDKNNRKKLKKEYKENPQRVKSLMEWKRQTKIVDICPICDKLFSEHSLKEMHVCEDKASVNVEEAKWNLEVVKSNWGKGGTICAGLSKKRGIMKIYLDDVRECPDGFVLCRTAAKAFQMISSGKVVYISFDHDLGGGFTGYDVAVYIEQQVAAGRISCPDWSIHSANPVGSKNIQAAMISAVKIEKNNNKEE